MRALADALTARGSEYASAVDRLIALIESDHEDDTEASDAARLLREAVELVRVLRRLAADRSVDEIHKAFGAPGDFGYGTPIGDALARIYGVIP